MKKIGLPAKILLILFYPIGIVYLIVWLIARNKLDNQEGSEEVNPPSIAKVCLGVLIIGVAAIAIQSAFFPVEQEDEPEGTTVEEVAEEEPSILVFDASEYSLETTEAELMELWGEPDEVDEWVYNSKYPVRTLIYGDYEFNFNGDKLHRITSYTQFLFDDKDNFFDMFGLQETSVTRVNDTNYAFVATNCGCKELHLLYEDDCITLTKIDYGSLFS